GEGYTRRTGFEPEVLVDVRSEGIAEGTTFIVEKDNQRVRIAYEDALSPSLYDAKASGQDMYSLGYRKKPDIRIDYFFREAGDWMFRESKVIDAKFRGLQHIRSRNGLSSAQRQLFSYWQFAHIAHARPVVSEVICLYPQHAGDDVVSVDQTITYIPLFPETTGVGNVGLKSLAARIVL
ncbi:MAG: hypothetical protein ACRC5C_05620, partial [Bacilli bacterium]